MRAARGAPGDAGWERGRGDGSSPPRDDDAGQSAADWHGRPQGGTRIPAGSAPRTERRLPRRAPLIAAIVGLVIVAVAAGGMLVPRVLAGMGTGQTSAPISDPFATYAPGPTPTVLPNFKRFASARSSYSIEYPAAWTVTSQEQTIQGQPDFIDIFTPAGQNPTSSLYVEQAAAAASTPDTAVIQSEVQGAEENGVALTPVSDSATTQTFGGITWQRRAYSVRASTSAGSSTEVILACHHDGRSYVVVYITPTATLAHETSATFGPALSSFRFAG